MDYSNIQPLSRRRLTPHPGLADWQFVLRPDALPSSFRPKPPSDARPGARICGRCGVVHALVALLRMASEVRAYLYAAVYLCSLLYLVSAVEAFAVSRLAPRKACGT